LVANPCDHDGKASGRLVLEEGGVRREIVCGCGRVMIVLGRDAYQIDSRAPRQRQASRLRRRLSKALLLHLVRATLPGTTRS
jgi:hypothetical protein